MYSIEHIISYEKLHEAQRTYRSRGKFLFQSKTQFHTIRKAIDSDSILNIIRFTYWICQCTVEIHQLTCGFYFMWISDRRKQYRQRISIDNLWQFARSHKYDRLIYIVNGTHILSTNKRNYDQNCYYFVFTVVNVFSTIGCKQWTWHELA